MNTTPHQEEQRRKGRVLACEGLMVSRFGRRRSSAGQKALERLRTEFESGAGKRPSPILSLTDADRLQTGQGRSWKVARPDRERQWQWMALAAALLVVLTASFLLLRRGPGSDAYLWAEGPGLILERNGSPLTVAHRMSLKPRDIIRTTPGTQARIVYGRDQTTLILAGNSRMSWSDHGSDLQARLWEGQVELLGSLVESRVSSSIETPQVIVKSNGAKFILTARPSSTWVQVMDGRVVMSQPGALAVTEVLAGHYSVVANGLKPTVQHEGERWQSPYYAAAPRGGTS